MSNKCQLLGLAVKRLLRGWCELNRFLLKIQDRYEQRYRYDEVQEVDYLAVHFVSHKEDVERLR